ncbi:MAG: TonB-dependent receptor plug domain-containing protein, partial [Hylemonella sp.]
MLSKKYIFCVGASVLMALPVGAQSLEGVVVSASRAEQRSFDAPASIQSVERDVIQDGGPQVNLSESLNRVPGLTILNRQNYAQDLQVSIRGFGARTAFGIRGVRLLIDGIPATTPDGQGQGSSISLPSTERIEVLRGPLAQLYGNSAGGVIQAFTREAPEVPELIYQYYGGSFGMHRNDLQYAGKSGKVGIVADYSTFDTNGYRDNSTTQRKQFNGKLSFGPDEKTRVNLVFNQFDMPLAQ